MQQIFSYFNTSHVTVYQQRCKTYHTQQQISIHPMLLFIQSSVRDVVQITNFNTSHVTVYQEEQLEAMRLKEFQYIPCYCLSFTELHFL